MKYGIYSIRDLLNGFSVPMCDFNDSTSKRNFKNALSSNQNANRGDYDLFRIGSFDVDTGIVTPEINPVLIMRGVDVGKDVVDG